MGNFIRRGKDKTVWSFLPRGHRPLRRRKVRSIPDAQAWASVMSLPCSSSPHQTRFAGLWRGPRLSVCAVRTPPTLAEPWQLGNGWVRQCFAPYSLVKVQQLPSQSEGPSSSRPPPHSTGRQAGGGVRSKQRLANFNGSRSRWPESRTEAGLDFARPPPHQTGRDAGGGVRSEQRLANFDGSRPL